MLNKLLDIGIKPELEFYQKREIRVVNLFAFITLFGLLVGVSTVIFISGDYALPTVLFSTFTSILILVLNYNLKYNWATYVFVITINLTLFVLVQQYEDRVGNYLYYFPVIFCMALIHNPTLPSKRTFIFFTIVVVSFLCSRIIEIPQLKNTTITQQDNEALLIYNSVLAFIVTIILVYLVVKLINRQNNDTLALLKKEQASQIVISNSLKEKETLLAEIQHRVKNNLAVITGLLNLQMEKAPCDVSKNLMIESRNRVMSMAMVHQHLYKRNDVSKIDIKQYMTSLIHELIQSFPQKHPIQINKEIDEIELELIKAVPAGLIINEIITNTLKHAFTDENNNPTIHIIIRKLFDKMQISVSDNGIGFTDLQNRKDTSLGVTLIESLAEQIDANVVFKNNDGATVTILIPLS